MYQDKTIQVAVNMYNLAVTEKNDIAPRLSNTDIRNIDTWLVINQMRLVRHALYISGVGIKCLVSQSKGLL